MMYEVGDKVKILTDVKDTYGIDRKYLKLYKGIYTISAVFSDSTVTLEEDDTKYYFPPYMLAKEDSIKFYLMKEGEL